MTVDSAEAGALKSCRINQTVVHLVIQTHFSPTFQKHHSMRILLIYRHPAIGFPFGNIFEPAGHIRLD